MIWSDILKIKIRPADRALSPTVKDFLRPTRSEETAAQYMKDDEKYAFNITNQTPEQIAEIIAEETTHHAQDIIGGLDHAYKKYHEDFNQNIQSFTGLVLPIAVAKHTGDEANVQKLAEIYANQFFDLMYKQIQENILLESHAKEAQNLEPVAKTIDLFTNYATQVIDVYLSLLPPQFEAAGVPEILKHFIPSYNIFKTKLSSLISKTIESILTENLANRTSEFRDTAVGVMGRPLEALKEKVIKFVLDNADETMDSVKEELNA